MKLRTPSHATVVAYLALFVAIGGSAYAVSKIGSAQIENRSIKGKDVADEALGRRQVDERKLEGPLAIGTATSVGCDPQASVSVDCIGKTIRLSGSSALVIIATGTAGSDGNGACSISVDGATSNGQVIDQTARTIAITKLTTRLAKGVHSVALSCTESVPDLSLSDLAISAIAVTNADLG